MIKNLPFEISGILRLFNAKALFVFLFLIIYNLGFAQTLISPTGDGGFETGTTFSSNGWTQVGTVNPTWYVGNGAIPYAGSSEVHIGTGASNFSSSSPSGVKHFYRDVTIPTGATNISLSFYMKMPVVDYSTTTTYNFDYFKVFTTSTSNTPVNNIVPTTGYTQVFGYEQPAISSWTNKAVSLSNSLAGTTIRLVFTFKNDGVSPNAYVALDNISLTYTPSTPYLATGTLSDFGNVCINSTSAANSFTLSGGNLTPSSNVTVGALAGFSYSLSPAGTYSSTLSVPTDASGNISSTSVFVKFSPTAVQSYNGSIPISGAGLSSTVNVAAAGSGINTAPSISANGTSGNITSSGATISGSPVSAIGCSSISAYGIEYSTTSGFVNGTGTRVQGTGFSGVSGGSFSTALTGLLSSTTYYYKAYATNSGGTTYYSTQGSFTTACAVSALPVIQGFNTSGSSVFPSCWTLQYVSGTKSITFETSAFVNSGTSTTAINPSEGSRFVYWNSYIGNGNTTRLVSLPVSSSGITNIEVDFNWFHSSDGGASSYLGEGVQVQYSTDGTTWTDAGSFIKRYDATLSGWTAKSVFLPAAAGNQSQLYIGFKFVSNAGYNCAMDAVVIKEGVACTTPTSQPTVLTFGTTTSSSIAGSFTGVASPNTPSGYMVVRSKSSTAPTAPSNGTSYPLGSTALGTDTYVVQNGTATTFADSSLTSNTQYYYYIYSYNSGCSGQPYYLTTSPLTGNTYTCLSAPVSNVATAVSASGFTANWTSLTGATGYLLDVSTVSTFASFVTGYNSLAVAGTSQAVTGLSSSTTYYYRVRATNATSCTSTNSATQTVLTLCTSQNVPYTENFNSTTGIALPNCTSAVNTGSGNIWATDASPGAYGFSSRVLKYTYNSSPANTWFFTKGLNLSSGTTYRLTFKYNNNSSSYKEKLKVAYGTSASVAGMVNTLADYPSITGGASIASTATIDFTPTVTGVYYIGFQAYSAASQYYLYVDDINVDVAPPAITVTPSNPNICVGGSVSLTASSTGSYTYSWSPATGLSATTGTTVTASPTVTTTYTVTGTNGGVSNTKTVTVTVNPVSATISITDTVSPATADACTTDYVKLDITGMTPINLINETFDSATPAVGWTVENYSSGGTPANADWKIVVSPYSAGNGTETLSSAGTKFAVSDSESQGSASNYTETYLNLPVLDTRGFASLTLNFDQYYRRYLNTDDVVILISTDGSTWSNLVSYTSTQGSASSFLNTTVNLDAYINQPTLYISFGYYSEWGYWWALDNVKVYGNQAVKWTPATGLYTNASLTTPYTIGTNATTLYAAPSGSQTYTATSFLGAGGACDKTASKSVTRDKYEFRGTNNNDWATASNWFPAIVPDANKCANIPASKTVEINSTATAKSITLDATGKLTIKANQSLTVADGLTINNNATKDNFVIETGANLFQQSTAANNPLGGQVQVQRAVSNIKNNAATTGMSYLFWSSPVYGQVTKGTTGFSPGTPNNRFFEYYEPTDTFKETNDATFVAGKGYAVRAEISGVDSPTYGKTYIFTGVPNNGDISIVLKRTKDSGINTGAGIGYNLVGNPYPSGIDLRKLFAANTNVIENLAYFWTNNVYTATQLGAGYSNYSSNNYAVFNGTGGNPATSAPGGDNTTPDGYVAVGQGFIVQAKNKNASATSTPDNTLVFKNSYSPGNDLRVAAPSHFFSKQDETPQNRFWIKLISPSNLANTQLIGYLPGATNGFDEKFDAEDISGSSDLFYSVLGSKQLLIQGRSEIFDSNDVVPVGANFYQAGVYRIAIDRGEGIFGSAQRIFLRDKLLNQYHDLTQGEYSFTASKGNNDSRFEIVYKEVTLQSNETVKSYFNVYRDGNSFTVSSSKKLGQVMLYDAAGKLIKMLHTKDSYIKIDMSAVPDGFYIIKADNSGDPRTKKIINTK